MGYCDFQSIYEEQVQRLSDGAHIVEIGCYFGKSTCFMAELIKAAGKKIKFDAIDTFKGTPSEPALWQKIVKQHGGSFYGVFINNVLMADVVDYVNPIIGESAAMSKKYEDKSLDFAFIDADHAYECVKNDINAWLPKIKDDGIIAGHDYHRDFPGVIKAVDELRGDKTLEIRRHSWLLHP